MKKQVLTIISILFLSFLSSCRDDLRDNPSSVVEEGLPAEVRLDFTPLVPEAKTVFRSSLTPTQEKKVKNVYLFVLDKNNNILQRIFFPYDAQNDKVRGEFSDSDGVNWLHVATTSGVRRFYAVANINDGTDNDSNKVRTLANIKRSDLDNITTYDDLMKKVTPAISFATSDDAGAKVISRDGLSLLMTGTKEFLVERTNALTTLPSVRIPLKRASAKITFKIATGEKIINFRPIEWHVYRAPAQVRLFNLDNKLTNDGDWGGSITEYKDVANANTEFGTVKENNVSKRTFSFYQFENRMKPKELISETDAKLAYGLREKRNKSAESQGKVSNLDFVYAADDATYIKMKVAFDIKSTPTTPPREALVTYTIHLGYTDANDKVNDFNVDRNTDYTYNVTINGIDDLIVEAQKETVTEEPAPGVEGEVNAPQKLTTYFFDSHYGVGIVRLDRSTAEIATKGYRVRTPYDVAGGPGDGYKDIKWVEFYKMDTEIVNAALKKVMMDSNIPADKKDDEILKELYKHIVPYPGRHDDAGAGKLKYVNEVVEEIKSKNTAADAPGYFSIKPNADGTVRAHADTPNREQLAYYIAFVNEYFYDKNPVTGGGVSWPEFVNNTDKPSFRRMIIAGNDKLISYDNNSRVTGSATVIQQEAIQTVYDRVADNRAIGFETIDETHLLPNQTDLWSLQASDNDFPTAYNDFAASMFEWGLLDYTSYSQSVTPEMRTKWKYTGTVNEVHWSDIVRNEIEPPIRKNVNNGIYPSMTAEDLALSGGVPLPVGNKVKNFCLSRNRDLNGDGKIDADEVRWVMPSYTSLLAYFLGQTGVAEMYRLYPSYAVVSQWNSKQTVAENKTYAMYWNCSLYDNCVMWGNEGISVSNYDSRLANRHHGTTWGSYSDGGINYNSSYTRCVRLLSKQVPTVTVGIHYFEGDQRRDEFVNNTTNVVIAGANDPSINARLLINSFRSTDPVQNGDWPGYYELSQHRYLDGYKGEPYNYNVFTDKAAMAKTFLVAKRDHGGESISISSYRNDPAKRCASYSEKEDGSDRGLWRLPNIRELYWISKAKVTPLNIAVTYLSSTPSDPKADRGRRGRYAYYDSSEAGKVIFAMSNGDSYGRVRCVRDLSTAEYETYRAKF